MRRMFLFAACILTMSGTALAASRAYDTGSFNAIEISAGIHVDIVPGPDHRVVAETSGDDFDDLQIRVEKGVLRIGRPARNWFSFGRRADYHVRVQSPALRSISASSGSRVTAEGGELATGAFALHASSGSNLEVQISRGNANMNLRAAASTSAARASRSACRPPADRRWMPRTCAARRRTWPPQVAAICPLPRPGAWWERLPAART